MHTAAFFCQGPGFSGQGPGRGSPCFLRALRAAGSGYLAGRRARAKGRGLYASSQSLAFSAASSPRASSHGGRESALMPGRMRRP